MTPSNERGLLDTSTLILLTRLSDPATIPAEPEISTITLAELSIEAFYPANPQTAEALIAAVGEAQPD